MGCGCSRDACTHTYLRSCNAGEKVRRTHAGVQAETHESKPKLRRGRRDAHIARQREAEPSANGGPVDSGNDRHGQIAHLRAG